MSDYQNDYRIRQQIAETLEVEIDEYCEASDEWRVHKDKSPFRRHLGSSQIGKSCSREIWYGFRWVKSPSFGSENRPAGRVMRLFNRGHREEPEIMKLLSSIGCHFDYTADKQAKFSACEKHAGTEVDNIGTLPAKFGVEERVLFEFKTASAKSFSATRKKGVVSAHPKYWDQMCFAAELARLNGTELQYALFVMVNKDDDDIFIEFHKLDAEHGRMLVDKANAIITADTPPAKISNSSTNFECKFCNFQDICHFGAEVERNCRSCKNAGAATEGNWFCKLHNQPIPADFISIGCDFHEGVK